MSAVSALETAVTNTAMVTIPAIVHLCAINSFLRFYADFLCGFQMGMQWDWRKEFTCCYTVFFIGKLDDVTEQENNRAGKSRQSGYSDATGTHCNV